MEDFGAIKIKLASPDKILSWSHGEVTKPETINYRTQKPEREGLFSEVIFGPEKDYQCYCGKYKKARFKGITCDRCGVEVIRSSVRRERMGHIQLATPVSHIWFLRKVPSKMGIFFNIPLQALENVIYFASYIILKVNDTLKETILKKIKGEREVYDKVLILAKGSVISEADWREISGLYPQLIEVGTGAEAVRRYAEEFDLEKLRSQLKASIKKTSGQEFRRILSRLRLVEGFIRSGTRPEWMFLTMIPVIPPELRPMVALDGGRFASSDVNDLYRRVINRNNRLKRLTELNAPEVIIRNEKRMLQEAVDALIDNSARRGRAVMAATGPQRQLKSLADMLRGKQGRFRKNLLGKRVDYSGRSVIVSGPELGLGECGLPKWMALEILRPFVIGQLVKRGLAHNIKGANTLITQDEPVVWEILDEISQEFFVLLNRAPTLHRLGIQAFKPRLIEGLAIELHPLVCAAFNADFDGDQMAVHLPLSKEAQKEAGELMFSSFNLLKPATGKPIVNPSQDIVLGIYWLTDVKPGLKGEGGAFSSPAEALLAYRLDKIHIQAKVKVMMGKDLIETSVGRILVSQALPEELPFVNQRLDKGALRDIVANMIERYDSLKVVEFLDGIKNLGFHYATASGITWSAFELIVPDKKGELLEKTEREVISLRENYEAGLLSEEERRTMTIQAWTRVDDEIGKLVRPAIERSPSIYTIINSGSRGSWGQTKQMAGMKGLVTNPYNEIIELPVRSSYKEGLNILEYFNSTHGARKGVTDTALKTSVAGYLTRRLVDVAHDVIVQEDDCKTKEGVDFYRIDAKETLMDFQDRIIGRVTAGTNQLIHKELAEKIARDPAKEIVTLRSPITCKTLDGICRMCFGYDLSRNKLIELGVAIGVIAAQSIGEPGTQLTMRTFHMGGVVGEVDITRGLPRIEEVFEAREPKGKALMSGVSGKVKSVSSTPTSQTILIETNDSRPKEKVVSYNIPLGRFLLVKSGDLIAKGDPLCEGPLDLKEIYEYAGPKATWRYILNEVQKNYNSHGAEINDKYIEVIIRKMFYFVRVTNPGDTNLIPGKVVELSAFLRENERVKAKKGACAQGERLLLGVTKASLSTESFLSAASFQETASALIDAAVEGKVDYLRGLKENVIIGRLIPAGTGYKHEVKKVKAQKEKVRVAT
ncbi:MAG: DNA-directed RNA polymerase subunit beta' [Candidatus Portnoybacteria bacterium]|nr:DNA-directed RNA polymerase subunit beta' [Candidatus Portnoybacteria bacterium]